MEISAILAGTDDCWEWGQGGAIIQHCRTTEDISNTFGSMSGHVTAQEAILGIASYAQGNDYFNDLDMLLIGVNGTGPYAPPGLGPHEEMSHLALWAALKSPLLLSANVSSLTSRQVGLLTHKGMLDVSQVMIKFFCISHAPFDAYPGNVMAGHSCLTGYVGMGWLRISAFVSLLRRLRSI